MALRQLAARVLGGDSDRKVFWALLGLVAAVRIAAIAILGPSMPEDSFGSQFHLPAAQRIISGLGFNDESTRSFLNVSPGYAYFIAAISLLFGKSLYALCVGQAVLDTMTAAMMYV